MDINTADFRLLGINIIGFLCLVFLLVLSRANKMLDAAKKRNFAWAGAELLIMIFIEAVDYLLFCLYEGGVIPADKVAIISYVRYVLAFIEYTLMPIIPATIIAVIGTLKHNIVWFFSIFTLAACITNIFLKSTGWYLYSIDVTNAEFTYGKLFFIPALVTFIGIAILVFATIRRYATFQKSERGILVLMFIFGSIIALLQFLYLKGTFLVWNTFAVFILVYYLLVHIQLYSLDSLTGLYNRQTYENDMNEFNERYDCTLIMIDLNNLKKINDIRGHAEGDRAINRIARFMSLSFGKVGRCYRIGGDEFAIICRCSEQKVNEAYQALMKRINEQEYTIAYGAVEYNHRGEESISTRFKEADRIMYENKAMIKRSLSLKQDR